MRRYVVSYTGRNVKRHTERGGTAVEICSPGCPLARRHSSLKGL